MILMRAMLTRVNVINITKLVDCANVSIGKEVARIKTSKPASSVALIGVEVLGCTDERKLGSHP